MSEKERRELINKLIKFLKRKESMFTKQGGKLLAGLSIEELKEFNNQKNERAKEKALELAKVVEVLKFLKLKNIDACLKQIFSINKKEEKKANELKDLLLQIYNIIAKMKEVGLAYSSSDVI